MKDMRQLISLVETKLREARRSTPEEFIQMAKAHFKGDMAKLRQLTKIDLLDVAKANDVQVPTAVTNNPAYKNGPHYWNLSGGSNVSSSDIDADVERDTGEEVEGPPLNPRDEDEKLLAKAGAVRKMASKGLVTLLGRSPKGKFVRLPGLEEIAAQLERMLSRQLQANGESTMEEQYEDLQQNVKLVATGQSEYLKSLLITGAPSSGKTYSVMKTIKESGLTEGKDYVVKKGRITVTSMYRTLIEQLHGLTIFDDCDSVVEDKNGINMLKGALDTDPVREVSYDVRGTVNVASLPEKTRNSYVEAVSRALRYKSLPEDTEFFKMMLTDMHLIGKALKGVKSSGGKVSDEDENEDDFADAYGGDDDEKAAIFNYVTTHLPNKIDFQGRIIFISNMEQDEWDSAILTRAFHVNMSFRDDEMMDFIDRIKNKIPKQDGSLPSTEEQAQRQEVWDFVRELWQSGKLKRAVNFRLAMLSFDLRKVPEWRRLMSKL